MSSSKTLSTTPPVFTFSNTVHTASLGVSLVRTITGTVYMTMFCKTFE